jgi:hypothetical protein
MGTIIISAVRQPIRVGGTVTLVVHVTSADIIVVHISIRVKRLIIICGFRHRNISAC